MKLYTRTGDDGTTGLFGGDRVGKDDPRIEAYGAVDEVNACLGLVGAACSDETRSGQTPFHRRLQEIVAALQSRLFDIGADLATPAAARHESKIVRIGEGHIADVEGWIDEIDGSNEPLETFVLPGGSEVAARLHLARTVCRRAERRMVTLARREPVNESAIVYVNRLSDLLFACARRANADAGIPDVPWKKG